jgi:hypothetical protein
MEFDITKVTIDGTVDDLSEEQLRELVGKFQDAQESNVAEFERATETLDELDEDSIEDFEEARESLIEDITGAEAFDEVPVSEKVLSDSEATSFSDLQDWKEFVSEAGADETDEPDEPEQEDTDFEDMGTEAPTNPDEDTKDFVEEELGSIQGLNL